MRKRVAIFTVLLATVAAIACAAEPTSYLCIADKATGFSFNKERRVWQQANFNVKDSKYLLSQRDGKWGWKRFGEQYDDGQCSDRFNEFGFLHCNNVFDAILFNKQTLRYQLFYPVGYVSKLDSKDSGSDTPSLEIGTCSAL